MARFKGWNEQAFKNLRMKQMEDRDKREQGKKRRASPEADLQERCVRLYFTLWHGREIIHIPNQGDRTKSYNTKLKRMGLRSGTSDLFVPEPTDKFNGAWIEMKHGRGKTTILQDEFLLAMQRRGYAVFVINSEIEFVRCVNNYFGTDYKI